MRKAENSYYLWKDLIWIALCLNCWFDAKSLRDCSLFLVLSSQRDCLTVWGLYFRKELRRRKHFQVFRNKKQRNLGTALSFREEIVSGWLHYRLSSVAAARECLDWQLSSYFIVNIFIHCMCVSLKYEDLMFLSSRGGVFRSESFLRMKECLSMIGLQLLLNSLSSCLKSLEGEVRVKPGTKEIYSFSLRSSLISFSRSISLEFAKTLKKSPEAPCF